MHIRVLLLHFNILKMYLVFVYFPFGLALLVLLLFLTASRTASWALPFLPGFLFLTVRFDDGGGAFCDGEIFIKLWIGVGFGIGCSGVSGGVIGYSGGSSGDSGCGGGSDGGGYILSSVLLLLFFFTVRFLAWSLFCLFSSGEFKRSPSPPFLNVATLGTAWPASYSTFFNPLLFILKKSCRHFSSSVT